MQRNFMAVAKQGELERELKVTTKDAMTAFLLLKKQKINKKWNFDFKDVYEVNINWEKVEVVEEVVLEEEVSNIE